jgi:catechol 2,3-dioxygenase
MESEALLVQAYRAALESQVEIHRTTDHKISRSIYLFDPDGNYLEFYCDATRDWRAVYASYEGKLISEEWDPLAREPNPEPMYEPAARIEQPEDSVFAPRRLARATVLVKRLDVSLPFYVEVAGMSVVADRSDDGYAVLSGGADGIDLALFEARGGDTPGLHHLSFELPDLNALERGLARRAERAPEVDVETLELPTKRSAVVRDPDGIACELFVDREAPGDVSASPITPFVS